MPSTIFSQIRRRPRRRRRKRVRKRTLALGSIRARCAADRGSDQHVSHGYMHCLRRELVHLTHTLTSAVRLGVSQARTADTAMTIINLSPRRFAARAHAVPTASGASRRPAAVPAACARTTADELNKALEAPSEEGGSPRTSRPSTALSVKLFTLQDRWTLLLIRNAVFVGQVV